MGKRDLRKIETLATTYRRVVMLLGAACVLLTVTSGSVVFGQVTGTIVGTVTDSTGALVPKVTIAATNKSTGFVRTDVTGTGGEYTIPLLPVGVYEVKAELTGFKTEIRPNIVVQVEAQQRVDMTLQVGAISEQVTVTGEAAMLQTDSATVGEVVNDTQMEKLPLNGRNFMQLTLLAPGLADPPNDLRHTYQGVAPSANGGRSEYNAYLMDGTSNTEHFNGDVSVVPPLDAIDQFKLQTADYSAEYGQGGGLVVNLVTKSGTNQFHASAWEFLRNSDMDARNFFATSKAPLKRNQYGGTIGGPIVKDKTFFFFAYEGLRLRKGTTLDYRVPTQLERQGNFSQSVGTLPKNPATGQPYSGNIIPTIDPISAKILGFVPLPNNPANPLQNYIISPVATQNTNAYVGRVDQNLSSKDVLFFRFNLDQSTSITPNGFVNCCDFVNQLPTRQGGIGYTRSLSPTAINEFRFGANRLARIAQDSEEGTNIASQLGVQNTLSGQGALHFFRPFSVTSFNFPASQAFANAPLDTFNFADNFTLLRNKHSLKMGGEFADYRFDDLFVGQAPAGFTFSGLITGNGLGDFLLGLPTTVGETYLQPSLNTRTKTFEAYFEDDWHVNSKVTINMGVRYTFETPTHQKSHREAWLDFGDGSLIIPDVANIGGYSFAGGIERTPQLTLEHNDNKVAPRLGFAYRPFGDSKTVIRSGAGMYTVLEQGNAGRQSSTNPPFRLLYSNTDNVNGFGYNLGRPPVAQVLTGLASGISAQFVDKNFRNGYMYDWNFTVEQAVAPGTVLSLAYVGSKGTELAREYNLDVAPPGPGAINPRRPYPLFSSLAYITNGSNSTYHSLQARAETRLRYGMAFLTSYTYSKTLGDESTINQIDFQNPLCLRCEKGPLWFDVRNRFVASYSYELPFGQGRRYLSNSSAGKAILGGWTIAGITSVQSGFPLTITTNDNANSGATDRPFLIGNPNPSNRTINAWIPRSAFAQNTSGPTGNCQAFTGQQYCFGNAGRGIVTSPGISDFDFSLIRNFRITEKLNLEFHGDFFDIFNHANFGFPNTTLSSGSFGIITSANDPRDVQLGLKLKF